MDAALMEEGAFDTDALEGELDGFEEQDAFEEDDALVEDEFELEGNELDAFAEEAGEGFEEGFEEDGFDEDAFAEGFEEDSFEEDGFEDEHDAFGDFAYDGTSGLFLPSSRPLIPGAASLAIARRLNPAVLESLNASEADEFFRRIRCGIRRIGGGIARGVRRVGGAIASGARVLGRAAGPILQRALPMIQRVAGFAGPWGRLVSAGIGAVRGIASGQGLRGALSGALGGLIPGVGGRIASGLLGGGARRGGMLGGLFGRLPGIGGALAGMMRGPGAGDDAALDALADMADEGTADAAIALPSGAGLAARVVSRRAAGRVVAAARPAERLMLRLATAIRGSAGRRLRILRSIARLAATIVRRQPRYADLGQAFNAAIRRATRIILGRLRARPAAGASSPASAARRNQARRVVLRRAVNAGVLPMRRLATI